MNDGPPKLPNGVLANTALPDWPKPPSNDVTLEKVKYRAEVNEVASARVKALTPPSDEPDKWQEWSWNRELKNVDADAALIKDERSAMLEVAKGSIDRGRAAAEFVRNAAAGVSAIYAGVVGVVFAADKGTPLPARGVIPAIFLGLALVAASGYVAIFSPGKPTREESDGVSREALQEARMNHFIAWTSEIARRNAIALHIAVFALGAGVATLPLPFINWNKTGPWLAALGALVAVLVGAALTTWRSSNLREEHNATKHFKKFNQQAQKSEVSLPIGKTKTQRLIPTDYFVRPSEYPTPEELASHQW